MKVAFVLILFLVTLYLLLLMLPQVSKKDKIRAFILFVLLIVVAYFFESSTKGDMQRMFSVIEAFKNGKTIECKGVKISNKDFNFVSGTNTFLGRHDSNYSMQRFQADECVEVP